MIRLTIWLTSTIGDAGAVGELVVADPADNGALQGQFRYDPGYLADPAAFALDPIHLPLREGVFDANRPYAGVHGIFEDSLPDDWGRRLLIRRYRLSAAQQRVPYLLQILGAAGMGALSFGTDFPGEKSSGAAGHELAKLVRLAEEFERDSVGVDADLAALFEAGSSPGGARPKVLVLDGDGSWLAKFPSVRDCFDVVRLEAATIALAALAGLTVPAIRLKQCGSRPVLLVERFDVTPEGGRRHLASLQTLTGAEGYYSLGYRDMTEVIRRVSSRPGDDLQALFRQMLFNVMIGNTDDHLKNFCLLHGEEGGGSVPPLIWCRTSARTASTSSASTTISRRRPGRPCCVRPEIST